MVNRVVLGNLVGFVTIFIVNSAIFCIGYTFTTSDVGALVACSIVASLVALRMWSNNGMPTHNSLWWLLVAVGSALVGALLFWLDIRFGFIVLPIEPDGGVLEAISNPLAVMVSVAFLPLFMSVAIACAVREALLQQ